MFMLAIMLARFVYVSRTRILSVCIILMFSCDTLTSPCPCFRSAPTAEALSCARWTRKHAPGSSPA